VKKYFKKILPGFFFLLISLAGMAQSGYPIQVTLLIKPPYPTKLTDYADDPNKILATITNTGPIDLYLWLTGSMTGDNGIRVNTSLNEKPPTPLHINPSEVKILLFSDLKTILNFDNVDYSGTTKDDIIKYGIPEGNYSVCIQALEYNDDHPLSEGEPTGCFDIAVNFIEPPLIITPMCEENIKSNSPQSVIFSWTMPAGANVQTQYNLKIVEVIPSDRNADDAMKSATTPVFFDQMVSGNAFIYGPSQPELVKGKRYAFAIRATDPFGKLSFKNDGFSEVCSFIYGDSIKDTTNLKALALSQTVIPPLPSVLPSYTKFIRNDFSYKDSTLMALNRMYQKAKSGDEKYVMAEVSFYTGRTFLLNDKFEEAKKYFVESIDTLRKISSTRNLWVPLNNLAFCYMQTGQFGPCKKALTESVNIIESNPAQTYEDENSPYYSEFLDAQQMMYETMVKQMVKYQVNDSALFYAERDRNYGKSRTRGVEPLDYQDVNSRAYMEQESKLFNTVDSLYSLLVKESSVASVSQDMQKLQMLKKVYTVTEKNYLSFIDSIVVEKPELSVNFSTNINPKDFFRDKQLIPENTLVAEYLVSDSAVYIFLVRKDTIISKTIPANKSTIETSVDKYVQLLSKNSKIDYVLKLSSELYNYLILPIEDLIKPGENLAIVPTGKLLKLPFQSLVKSGKDKNQPVYLIEKNPVYYINSLRMFYTPNNKVGGDYKVMAFGNPDNSLPFAEEEVNELKTINPNSEIYVKDAATETKAKTIPPGFDVIHFATHGVLDFNKFQNSYILLAPDKEKKEDGKLTMAEIIGITNLRNLSMVTLSACNTAVSTQKIKGWINNPAQSFIDIGVKSVVATLWSVDDKATSMLMKEFYTNLKTKTKSDAIRDAQITLIKSKEFKHPYYWAPFVLIGDYR